jgi:hypothetical protein
MGYVVAVKPSARRVNAAAGEWVNREGPRRPFDSKAAAREWARSVSDDSRVWVRDANPNDPAPVDGYLVGRALDPARRRSDPPGEQARLADGE